jgi:Spy/CpxP family protein refolding chaperone
MKVLKTFVVVAVAALLATAAMAQRGQGGMRMMGGPGDSSGTMLLQRSDVQKDLGLTDEQKTKLDAMRQKMMDDMRAQFQNGGGGGDREAMQKAVKEMMDKAKAETAKILTKEQTTRLHEISIQVAGNGAIQWEDVQKELGMTSDQVAKVKDLQTKQAEANQAIFQKMRDGEIDREELPEIMKKNQDTMNVELGKILKEEQKTKLKAMGGKPFKADANNG